MSASFLNSIAWQKFQESLLVPTSRFDEQLFLKHSFYFGQYWSCSRCQFSSFPELPSFSKSCCFLRLEPENVESLAVIETFAKNNHIRLQETLASSPKQTTVIDLEKSPETILKNMKAKHRYNLHLAEKANLNIEIHSNNLENVFPRFWQLLTATAQRQAFRTHPEDYYRKMLQQFGPLGMVHLLFVKKGEEDLATLLLLTYHKSATYLHGASSLRYKELMAPYLLHWTAILFAKSQGNSSYDFWGIQAHYQPEKKEWISPINLASTGITRFKLGFSGTVLNYPGTFDLVLEPFRYLLYRKIRALKGKKEAFV